MAINCKELFPTHKSVVIFFLYMSLFVAQGILITVSQSKNHTYTYNTITVVLLTELLKLVVSGALYSSGNSVRALLDNIWNGTELLALYFIPAFLYCLYNNLAFINLLSFDPTTYFLLLQLRVVFTGILFQVIFKKKLSKLQWFSLILLTCGCMIKQINFHLQPKGNLDENTITQTVSRDTLSLKNVSLILLQTICSCLAGVYNEFLLKKKGPDVNIYIQNVYMYLDSIVCNIVVILLNGNLTEAFTFEALSQIARYDVIFIIINNCLIGIVTSFFLKHLNSILKTFASAIELMFTAVLSYMIFGLPIYLNTILAILLVSISIYLYSQSPVINTVSKKSCNSVSKTKCIENQMLLENEKDSEKYDLNMENV